MSRFTILPPARIRVVQERGPNHNRTAIIWSDDRRFDADATATVIHRHGSAWTWTEPVIPREILEAA